MTNKQPLMMDHVKSNKQAAYILSLSEIQHYVIGGIALVYVGWFLVELIQQAQRNGWSFNTLGLTLMSVHIALVFLLGILEFLLARQVSLKRREIIMWTNNDTAGQLSSTHNVSCLQFTIPVLCIVVAVGYFYLYIPLQSDFFVWLLRWVPWVIVSLLGLLPCCCYPICRSGRYTITTNNLENIA
jgi:hypothetical protein